jgi:hypothetical protein
MFQNLNEKSNKESHYIAIKLQPRFNCAISRICEYYFIDRQEKTNDLRQYLINRACMYNNNFMHLSDPDQFIFLFNNKNICF